MLVPSASIKRFVVSESFPGILVMLAAALAMFIDNSPISSYYHAILDLPLGGHLGTVALKKPLLLWINDGLMSVFFLMVGLEIKREMLQGELSSLSKSLLPVIGAIGGMLVPAVIYLMITIPDFDAMKGWAIPTATDIAFALALIAMLGKRVPMTLKVFVTALAIFDDVGAIAIIAIFYAGDISILSLSLACVCFSLLMVFNVFKLEKLAPYLCVGVVLWLCVLKSGVHATLAGVALAQTIPLESKQEPGYSPLKYLEHKLHSFVVYVVLPLFAFANAGVSLSELGVKDLLHPVSLGIVMGLFLGKQLGIFAAVYAAIKMRLCDMPKGCRMIHLYGASLLCGVGFTMSLFIGMLAFDITNPEFAPLVRIGVIIASLLSGIVGYYVLNVACDRSLSKPVYGVREPFS